MKPSARVALIVALAATTAPTWASLPFYSPDYTFDSTTGTGFTLSNYASIFQRLVSPDGKAANTFEYHESDVSSHEVIAMWRGPTALPSPQLDSVHSGGVVEAINRSGWTCGYTLLNDVSFSQAAMWQPDGSRIDLPYLSSSFPTQFIVEGRAFDINDDGIAVGYANKLVNNAAPVRPVYWLSSREVVELANPLAASNQAWSGQAFGVSPNGVIAGVVGVGDTIYPMKWHVNGSAQVLSMTTDSGITFDDAVAGYPLDDGTVLGWGQIGTSNTFGVLWSPSGEAIELRNLPDSPAQRVFIYGINRNHYSAGRARNSLDQRFAVCWSPTGEPMALDRLSDIPSNAQDLAADINDLNFLVGWSVAGSTYVRAVLWTPAGDAIDMNSLIESDEWSFTAAGTITNTGWISGIGNFDPTGPAAAYDRPFSILVPFAGTYGMGDANFDESIDFADLLIVAQNYGTSTNGSFDVGDFNLDGSVDFTDLLAIAQNYGDVLGDATGLLPNSPNPTFESDWQVARGMVPEPGAVGLICIGLMLLTSRKRERRAWLEIESNFGAWEFDRR